MKVCLSFDDGRADQYSNAFKVLKEFGLTASFHVTTGFIDGSFVDRCFGTNRLPMTKAQLVEMKNSGMDVSSHGDKHIMESDDYALSISKLNNWGLGQKRIGFSVPNSQYNQNELSEFIKNNKNISYVRVGRHKKCYTFLNKIRFVLYNKLHFSMSYNSFNKFNLMYSLDKFSLCSLVIRNTTRFRDLKRFLEKYSHKDCTLVIMLHSITEDPKDSWEWSKGNFEQLCQFLSKSDHLKVVNLQQLCEGI